MTLDPGTCSVCPILTPLSPSTIDDAFEVNWMLVAVVGGGGVIHCSGVSPDYSMATTT